MSAGIQQAVVASDEFVAAVAADLTENVVGIDDASLDICHGDDQCLLDGMPLRDHFPLGLVEAVFRERLLGDVLMRSDPAAPLHRLMAGGDDPAVAQLVDDKLRLAVGGSLQAAGEIVLGILRAFA